VTEKKKTKSLLGFVSVTIDSRAI